MENHKKKTNSKHLHSPQYPPTNNQEISQLFSTFDKLLAQNQQTSKRILQIDASFQHNLYNPKKKYGFNWQIQKQLKIKQIERLLEQRQILAKYQQAKKMKKMFDEEDQLKMLSYGSSQFRYGDLRGILRSVGNQGLSCMDRIDQLNRAIKDIKGKVDSQLIYEKNQLRNPNKSWSNPCVSSKTFWKLQQRMLQMQQTVYKVIKQNKRLKTELAEKQEQISKIIQQNQYLRQQLQQHPQKLAIDNIVQTNQIQQINTNFYRISDIKHRFQSEDQITDNRKINRYDDVNNNFINLGKQFSLQMCRSSGNIHVQNMEQKDRSTQFNCSYRNWDMQVDGNNGGFASNNSGLNRVGSMASLCSGSNVTLQRVLRKQEVEGVSKEGQGLKKRGVGRRWQRTSTKQQQQQNVKIQRLSVATTSTGQNL